MSRTSLFKNATQLKIFVIFTGTLAAIIYNFFTRQIKTLWQKPRRNLPTLANAGHNQSTTLYLNASLVFRTRLNALNVPHTRSTGDKFSITSCDQTT